MTAAVKQEANTPTVDPQQGGQAPARRHPSSRQMRRPILRAQVQKSVGFSEKMKFDVARRAIGAFRQSVWLCAYFHK